MNTAGGTGNGLEGAKYVVVALLSIRRDSSPIFIFALITAKKQNTVHVRQHIIIVVVEGIVRIVFYTIRHDSQFLKCMSRIMQNVPNHFS